ncbi:MAG: outer membrane protein assembly factor BamA [Treponema sp.]|nr:outer membrane protein assembly factor BamA [Spirochaetia bacterium]MDD7015165.1 outer membrane protein assembly factor BamA [Spirochaetales bacterium]MDY4902607.1 outer membrane protein assembly factor BamA [Treponema sp.]
MKFKHIFGIFLAVALSVTSVFSQESDDWYYNRKIKNFTYKNLTAVKSSSIDAILNRYIGEPFTDEITMEIYNKLFDMDSFEDLSIEIPNVKDKGSDITLIINFVERPVVAKVVVTGNHYIHTAELKEQLFVKESEIYKESDVLLGERSMRNHYIDNGYAAATVTSKTEVTPKGVVVTYTVDEGRQTIIKKIDFQGNTLVSSKTLKSKISLKEAGLFNSGAYQEASVNTDSKTIVNYYQTRGYVDAKVAAVDVEKTMNEAKNREELTITFRIQEGRQYKFGGVTFVGNQVFSTEKLQSLVKLEKGKVYNETKFQEAMAAVQNLYVQNGYTSNQFSRNISKDTENMEISYTINIYERPRSHIEKILIKGNNKTKDNVILREIPIEEGDIFSNAKIISAIRNLNNLQYFSSVLPDVTSGSEENLVDIVFTVQEQSTTTLDFGFTFSGVSDPDDFPISLYVKLQDSNLFGEGRSVSVGTTLSTTEQSFSLGYGQNWLFGKPISTSFSAGYSHSTKYALRNLPLPDGSVDDDYYYLEYDQHEFNLSFSLGHRWTPNFAILTLAGGISGSLIDNIYDENLYIPYDSTIGQYNNNWEPKNSIFGSFSADGRDINYDPSSGWFASERLAWYGLLPEGILPFAKNWGEKEFYLRSDTKAEKYFTLMNLPVSETYNFKAVLMLYSGLSFQFPFFDTTIKQSNQLYIDGMFNGRGWTIYNTAEGRGSALWSNSVELRLPLVPGVLAVDGFFDAVALKDSVDDFFTGLTIEDWYFSFGPDIRFTIPQFPLRLLFCNTFKVKDGNVVFCDQDGDGDYKWYNNFHFVLSFNLTNK